ncbi:hypothetical protein LC065_12690 [Halobacillus litoralis]|uniref:YczE/YyaS/YitT family protein n=1 Tax=Halobacillus litoralis TaxID=45668 RepID=UPI00273F403F|nr:hypothetical protein [Halobacillus litoralis]WLR46435.1 hypothetical protein LC065_12690 [Halobacillus litoralis]
MLYRATVYLVGMFINFFGVALLINATLGAGFWTSFFIGVSDHFGYTVGFWYGAFQLIIIFINAKLMNSLPESRAVVPVFLESLILDFWLEFVFAPVNLSTAPFALQVVTLFAGVGFIGLGVAIYILPQFPRAPVDQLFLGGKFQVSVESSDRSNFGGGDYDKPCLGHWWAGRIGHPCTDALSRARNSIFLHESVSDLLSLAPWRRNCIPGSRLKQKS